MRSWPVHCGYAESVCARLFFNACGSKALLSSSGGGKYHIEPQGVKRATEASITDNAVVVGVGCFALGKTLLSSRISTLGELILEQEANKDNVRD